MIRCIAIAILLLLATHGAAQAQRTPPEEWFNRAAKEYIKDDKVTALRTLDKALREHPGDPRLLKLAEELLQDQEQDQQQQPDDQQQQDGDDQQDQNKDQGKDQQQDQQQQQERQQPRPDRIDPQDAKRMLDALERKEQDTQERVRERQRATPRTPRDKDW